MVAVASLVVHPRLRISKQLTLALIGATRPLIVACARDKFGWTIFGQIVKKALKPDPCTEAMRNHAMAVLGDSMEVQKRMWHNRSLFSIGIPKLYHVSDKLSRQNGSLSIGDGKRDQSKMQINPLLPSLIMRSSVSESLVRDSSGICSSLVCNPSLTSS